MKIGNALAQPQARGPEGLMGFLITALVCGVISLVTWLPISVPPRVLHSLLSDASRGTLDVGPGCGPVAASTSYLCSLEAGAVSIVPAVVFSVVLFLLRKQIAAWLRLLLGPRLPESARFLLAPSIATLGFAMSWGYVHAASPYQVGIVPEIVFPALVGLFTFTIAQHGSRIAQSGGELIVARDRLPMWARVAGVIVIPLLVSLLLTSQRPVAFVDLKQQLIVLVSLVIGFVALVPRWDASQPGPGVTNDHAAAATRTAK